MQHENFNTNPHKEESPFSPFVGGQFDCSLKKCCKKYKKKSKNMCKSCPKR